MVANNVQFIAMNEHKSSIKMLETHFDNLKPTGRHVFHNIII